jgi:hypothetical protein
MLAQLHRNMAIGNAGITEISAVMRKHFHLRARASAFQLDGERVK